MTRKPTLRKKKTEVQEAPPVPGEVPPTEPVAEKPSKPVKVKKPPKPKKQPPQAPQGLCTTTLPTYKTLPKLKF